MTSIIFHSRRPNTQKKTRVTYLPFLFQLNSIFPILRSWKARISHCYISPQELRTKQFRVFREQKSRIELKWRQTLLFRGVETSNMPIENTGSHIQFKVSEFISIYFSYVFCVFNRVTTWSKGKTIIFVQSSFQICHLEILFRFNRKSMSYVYISVSNSKCLSNL